MDTILNYVANCLKRCNKTLESIFKPQGGLGWLGGGVYDRTTCLANNNT